MWIIGMAMALMLWSAAAWAEPGFDSTYERDYNIFTPTNELRPDNPNNPFNPINKYRPDNPLNPINKYNPAVPFAPLDGGSRNRNEGK